MKNIDDEIEKTLGSLQGAQRATTSESFIDDLQEKLSYLPTADSWLQWLRYGVAAMVVLGLVNIFALTQLTQPNYSEDLGTDIAEELLDSPGYFFESME